MKKIKRLSEAQNHRCCYCGHRVAWHTPINGHPLPSNTATRDHIIPRCHGGTYGDNIIIACLQCNNLRGDMEAVAFFNLLQKWFKRNPQLRTAWHTLETEVYRQLFEQCLHTHERQLRGLARRHIEYAFRHLRLLYTHGHLLRV